MSARVTGIYIGTTSVRLVEVKNGKPVRFIEEDLPDNMVRNGQIVAFNALGEYLREVRKKDKIRTTAAAVVLSDEVCVTRRVRLPKMTVAQLKVNLPYEFHDYIQGNPADYVFDYALIRMDGSTMELMACAASKKLIDRYRSMLKRAGFKLTSLAPEEIAFQNIVLPPADIKKRQEGQQKAEKIRRKEDEFAARKAKSGSMALRRRTASGVTMEELAAQAAEEAMQNGFAPETPVPGTAGEGTLPAQDQSFGASGMVPGASAEGPGTGARAAGSPADEREGDYAILYFGHTTTKLHFFSKGTYEITRTLDTSSQTIVDQIASDRGMDPHLARIRLQQNQDDIIHSEEVQREFDSMATEVMRVLNFYNYNNPQNTLDRIHVCGNHVIVNEMKERIFDVTQMQIVPLTELIPGGAAVSGLDEAPQAFGVTVS